VDDIQRECAAYQDLVQKNKGIDLIDKGQIKPGDEVSTEREYAEKFHISRMNVRQALTHLVNE
jgi:DNA-binding GntR family transcriptional regulator